MREHSRTSNNGSGAGRRHRKLAIALILTALALAALATFAAATSSRGLNTDRARATPQRMRQPPLAWLEGTLRQSRTGSWTLSEGTPLHVDRSVRWREEEGGHETLPSAGREVRLMGQWYGNTFRVRQATLLSPQWAIDRSTTLPVTTADVPAREQPQ